MQTPIQYNCPSCDNVGTTYGKMVTCKACNHSFLITTKEVVAEYKELKTLKLTGETDINEVINVLKHHKYVVQAVNRTTFNAFKTANNFDVFANIVEKDDIITIIGTPQIMDEIEKLDFRYVPDNLKKAYQAAQELKNTLLFEEYSEFAFLYEYNGDDLETARELALKIAMSLNEYSKETVLELKRLASLNKVNNLALVFIEELENACSI